MKYHFEMTEGEFIAWQKTVKTVVKVIAATTLEHAKLRKTVTLMSNVKAAVSDAVREHLDGVEADEEDNDNDDGDEGATVTPFPVAVKAPEEPDAAEQAAEEKRVKVLHGKDQWIALIEVWRTNFGVEGAPQPDRVANLGVAFNPFVLAYLAQRDGLTHATREAIYLLDGGDPEAASWPLTAQQVREARLIAENIAQVASFHAPELAEQLEYAHKYRTLPTIED
jgi:hypothetical protein